MVKNSLPKSKIGAGLRDCIGLLPKDDKEYKKIMEELKPLCKEWTKRYALK